MYRNMLKVKNLSKYYGDTAALSGISFHIAPGETTGIFGMIGSGKTTLLDILSGYLLKYGGCVELEGKDIRKDAAQSRKEIAYIPQGGALYQEMTVREYMRFLCGINRIRSTKQKNEMKEVLEFSGLANIEEYPIRALNALDQAKVSIAAALALQPKVLLIDQPFHGLRTDEAAQHKLFLKAVAQRTTLVIASDTIGGFSDLCKRTIILNKGRIASDRDNLFDMPARKMGIRLRVACAPTQVRAAFRFVSGVAEMDFHSTSETGVWDVVVNAKQGEDIRHALWFAAASYKVPVLEMRSLHISPEDIYLQLSGREQEEEE